jgi:hypothetical protein
MNAVVESHALAESEPMKLVRMAVAQGWDLDRLQRVMDLERQWRADMAKRAYITAFAMFKKNAPDVVKDMLNKQYNSNYSSLANLVNTVNKSLGEYDLNARWKITQGEIITVTCVMTHAEGHSEEVTLAGPLDASGQKNSLQQIKSTLTYLEGATFQAVTGVVARQASTDDDGKGAGAEPKQEPAPEGYDNWRADMTALAEEGIEKLQASWSGSTPEFRRHVIKADETWWNQTKSKARKAGAAVPA